MWKQRIIFLSMSVLVLLAMTGGEKSIPADASVKLPAEPKYIALTFDDGPRRATTTELLDGLKARGVNATFFLIGEQIAGNEDLVKRMKEEGHQVGNHTWSHVKLQGDVTKNLIQEVEKTDRLLRDILGEDTYWLRPPYGRLDAAEQALIKVPMVKWNVDPEDWKSRDTAKVVKSVLEQAKPNAIILLHDIYPTSVKAALKLVDALQAKGYTFVTVEELLALNDVTPQSGTLYRSGTG